MPRAYIPGHHHPHQDRSHGHEQTHGKGHHEKEKHRKEKHRKEKHRKEKHRKDRSGRGKDHQQKNARRKSNKRQRRRTLVEVAKDLAWNQRSGTLQQAREEARSLETQRDRQRRETFREKPLFDFSDEKKEEERESASSEFDLEQQILDEYESEQQRSKKYKSMKSDSKK